MKVFAEGRASDWQQEAKASQAAPNAAAVEVTWTCREKDMFFVVSLDWELIGFESNMFFLNFWEMNITWGNHGFQVQGQGLIDFNDLADAEHVREAAMLRCPYEYRMSFPATRRMNPTIGTYRYRHKYQSYIILCHILVSICPLNSHSQVDCGVIPH